MRIGNQKRNEFPQAVILWLIFNSAFMESFAFFNNYQPMLRIAETRPRQPSKFVSQVLSFLVVLWAANAFVGELVEARFLYFQQLSSNNLKPSWLYKTS
jgi:hypothetical protein